MFIDDNLGGYEVTPDGRCATNIFVSAVPGSLLRAREHSRRRGASTSPIGEMSGNVYCAPFGDAVFQGVFAHGTGGLAAVGGH